MMVATTGFILLSLKSSARHVRKYLCNIPNSFCPSLSEYHAGVWMKKLWIFDEAKATSSFIPSAEVLLAH